MISKNELDYRWSLYGLLSRLYRLEADAALLDAIRALQPGGEDAVSAGLKAMQDWLAAADNAEEQLAVDYAVCFLAAGSAEGAAALPYESVYTSRKKIFMQEAWEEICRLYGAYGLIKDPAYPDLFEDHLSFELDFAAYLGQRGEHAAMRDFLDAHLLNWLPAFAADVQQYAKTGFYQALAQLTLAFVSADRAFAEALVNGEVGIAPAYSVRSDRFKPLLARLQEKYRVFAPMRQKGRKGMIRYGEISCLEDIEYKQRSQFSPKEVFYPVSQTMYCFTGEEVSVKEPEDEREILLIARACDCNAVRRLDQIFLHNGQPDLFYARVREKVKLVLLECGESFDNCFCASVGTNEFHDYAAAIRIDDICALMEIRDEDLLPYFADEVPANFAPEFVQSNARSVNVPNIPDRETLKAVCTHPYWDQYDETCISCGGCCTVCPTCSCFDTVDVRYDETSPDGERRRVWSSCMLKDFTRTAGGGMSRKTAGANMRFKVLHKFHDFKERFGTEHMCVGCGRCIDRCPKQIDFLDAVNGLTAALERGE